MLRWVEIYTQGNLWQVQAGGQLGAKNIILGAYVKSDTHYGFNTKKKGNGFTTGTTSPRLSGLKESSGDV
jgi:hypothetical protein